MKKGKIEAGKSQFLVYQAEDGQIKIDVRLENETVWLTQKLMAELFQTSIPNINMHVNNIFEEGELATDSVIKEFLTTAADGKQYRTKFYNLDMIISVGYRIKSHVATSFRQWATKQLREYIVKGFVLGQKKCENTLLVSVIRFQGMLHHAPASQKNVTIIFIITNLAKGLQCSKQYL